ncbi:hypothetical protein [Rufibacter immobilis]|uniref:hypothetical protein n=1 Tax=Rufibacter immobilis TaxID=1348778 RepID=UPI0035E67939
MITRESYQKVLINPVSASANRLITFLKSKGLTPTVDVQAIKQELKNNLFERLLSVDAGLRMRHEMAKTDDAKRSLLETTVNLDGYTEIQEAANLIQKYEQDYGNAYGTGADLPLKAHAISAEAFISVYGGSVEAALGDKIIDLSEHKLYKKMQQAEALINDFIKEGLLKKDNGWHHDLNYLMNFDFSTNKVKLNERAAYHKIAG